MTSEIGLLDTIVKTLGAPGLILICLGGPSLVMAFMYKDHRRYEAERLEVVKADGVRMTQAAEERARVEARHQDEMSRLERQLMSIINEQNRRFEVVVKNYENNVLLVEHYQKLANDLAGIIHLNTQMMTKLIERIDNNQFCPIVKERGGKNGI